MAKRKIKNYNSAYWILVAFVVAYIGLSFLVQPDPESLKRYDLTVTGARLLSVSITIPLVAIWYALFYGFIRLKTYTHMVRKNPDGRGFDSIANGVMVLGIGLPLNSLLQTVLNIMSRNDPNLIPTTRIIGNYLSLALMLAAVMFIYQGASRLHSLINRELSTFHKLSIFAAIFAVETSLVYLALSNPAREVAAAGAVRAAYYLPDWLSVSTILVPYVFAWLLGLVSAAKLDEYHDHIKGVFYKQALSKFVKGLSLVIASSILTQYLTTASSSLSELSLAPLLALIYALLAIIASGYVMIALGAKRLQRIEEV